MTIHSRANTPEFDANYDRVFRRNRQVGEPDEFNEPREGYGHASKLIEYRERAKVDQKAADDWALAETIKAVRFTDPLPAEDSPEDGA